MATNPDRASHFPAIEKKYGHKMAYWHSVMKEIADWKYPEQIAYLKENYGFSQTHANALVMYSRGSKSSRRFSSLDDYLKPFSEDKQATVRSIFAVMEKRWPQGEVVIAWNQPMFRYNNQYIFGVTVLKNHILMAPWSKDVLADFSDRLSEFEVLKKTIKIPVDWRVNQKLIRDMAAARIAETKEG